MSRIETTSPLASATPAGGVQHAWICARSRSSSLCDRAIAVPDAAPSEAVWLMVGPVAASRRGSRLSSSASILLASKRGCGGGGFFGGTGVSTFFGGSGFFDSSRLIRSATASGFGSSAFSRFSGFASGGGGGGAFSAEAVVISGLSETFGVGSFTCFGSPTLSTTGRGVAAFGAFCAPAIICENSVAEIMSTGSDSAGAAENGLAANDTTHHASSATCPTADMVTPVFIARASGSLLDLRHQRDAAEARLGDSTHDAHHCTVIHLAVATHVDAFLEAAAPFGHGLELRHQLLDLDFAVLQEDLALHVDRKGQRLLVLVETFRLGLRKVDRHADREQRR